MKTLLAFLLMVSVANAEQVGDMNADGKIDTTESIISLRVAAGLQQSTDLDQYIPATGNAVEFDVLQGKTFSNGGENNLVGTYTSPSTRTIGCSTANVWDLTQCVSDCNVAFSGTSDLNNCLQYCVAIKDGIDDGLYGSRIPCIKLL